MVHILCSTTLVGRRTHGETKGIDHEAAGTQAIEQQRIGLVLPHSQQLELALHIHLQALLEGTQAA